MGITSVTLPNDVKEKNDFSLLNPTRCISAVQTALMGGTSVDNTTMFKLQSPRGAC